MKLVNVDICALDDKYLAQASHGRFAEIRTLQANLSGEDIRPLHKNCQNGEHYMAHTYIKMLATPNSEDEKPEEMRFYIIKNNWCTVVNDLERGSSIS